MMRHRSWLALLFVGWTATTTMAAERTFELTVKAGPHDRMNTPVEVPIVLPDAFAANRSHGLAASLQTPDGQTLPAQVAFPGLLGVKAAPEGSIICHLHFILPSLKKGKSLELTAVVMDQAAASTGFHWSDTAGDNALLSHGDRPVLRYMYRAIDESSPKAREETYKVFHHLYNPAGTQVVTKGPGGQFTHHRGLFYGFNRVTYGDGKRVDTWHCSGDTHLAHAGFLASEAGPVLGRHRVHVNWHGVGKEIFAKEARQMAVYHIPGGQLVEFVSSLKSADGPIQLAGDPQHAGFQFRAAQAVAAGDQKATYYLRPDGKGKPGETRNWPGNKDFVNLPWNAMSFVINGTRYTAVYLDKPTNPKEARFSERTYGRFGSYFEYELDDEDQLLINYRVWVQEGEMTVDQAAALSADFVEPVEVVVN